MVRIAVFLLRPVANGFETEVRFRRRSQVRFRRLVVLLVVPLGLVGAVIAVWARGLENNIFFQVGLLTTMGLAAKNAILIVEFAELAHRQGKDPLSAAIEAARLRFRPILMTTLAALFAARDRDDWTTHFAGTEACVTPVLSLAEAPDHPHNRDRATFRNGLPGPAPIR